MKICISTYEKDPSNYDYLYYLGFLLTTRECAENEFCILDKNNFEIEGTNWVISTRGISTSKKCPYSEGTKEYLQECYKKGINQIVLNDRNTNYTYNTLTGEIIQFIGINNHLEIEI